MTLKMKTDDIARLVLAYKSGNICPEDESALLQWRAENPANEQLFHQLMAEGYLEEEYSKWRSIDSMRPRADMTRRIRRSAVPAFARVSCRVAAAVALLGIGIWTGYRFSDFKETAVQPVAQDILLSEIAPGKTQATLTTAEGEVFNFTEPQKVREIARRKADDRARINNLDIPRGGEFHITLEDGTEVWLNAQTSLKYPEVFSDSLRSVEITGEGYFKVAKDNSRPFIVRTEGQTIKVYGTEFNVNSYADDEDVVTTLVEGSVSLISEGHSSNELMLAPGHQAVFSKAKDETVVKSVNTDVVTSWRNDMFVFDDLSLDKIMRQLSRWYDFDYVFRDDAASQIVFKGRIPRYGKFGDALTILEKSGGLSFEVEGKTIFISKNNRI